MATIELGDKALDPVTRMVGIVTVLAHYLHGPDRLELTGMDAAGRPIERWITAHQCELVSKAGAPEEVY